MAIKHMKRIGAALLAVCTMLAVLSGCSGQGGNAEEASREAFTGTWVLSGIEGGERDLSQSDLNHMRTMGFGVFIELEADGTAILDLFESETEGTWEPGTATEASLTLVDNEVVPMTIEDGVLTLEQDNQMLHFTRYDDSEAIVPGSTAQGSGTTLSIDPITVVDDDALSIVIESKASDRLGDVGINATVTNRGDEPIRVRVLEDSASIGGKMVSMMGGQVIQPGKYAEIFFWFDGDAAGTSNPEMLVEVEGVFEVTNEEGTVVLGTYPFSF